MWAVNGEYIKMTEGDFGVALPITISGTTFAATDEVKLTIKASVNGEAIIEKPFNDIQQNTVDLVLTESESALLPVGNYVYSLDWYQSGVFMYNIIPQASYKVVEKA